MKQEYISEHQLEELLPIKVKEDHCEKATHNEVEEYDEILADIENLFVNQVLFSDEDIEDEF